MKSRSFISGIALWCALLAPNAFGVSVEQMNSIPLAFTLNEGQADHAVRFTARGSGCGMAFSPSGTTFLLSRETAASASRRAAKRSAAFEDDAVPPEYESFSLKLAFVGANGNPEIQGEDRLPWNSNYFIGSDPAKWRTDVPNYGKIRLREVYDGIDLVYYGNRKRVKYDFVVRPGEDPEKILLEYDFGESGGSLSVNADGELVVSTPVGELIEEKPYCYQMIDGEEVEVGVAYEVLGGGAYRFRVGEYDKSAELVIDPELVYSTYLGGYTDDKATGVALDAEGCAYVIGRSAGVDFPITPGALDSTSMFMFITKISADGTSLVYSTFIGGDDSSGGKIAGIAVDSGGNAYVAGSNVGPAFPTTDGAYKTYITGTYRDSFVSKLNALGNALIYSTFLGGSKADLLKDIAIDSEGNVFVSGLTASTDFPTTPGSYREIEDSDYMGFLTKLNQDGSALVYSTFIWEANLGDFFSVEVDMSGCAFVAGETRLSDFPVTPGSYQHFLGGIDDIYVTKFNADGSNVIYSALFGGSKNDCVTGVAVDAAGNAYICGYTESEDYPTTSGAFQETNDEYGDFDGFITKLNNDGSALIYSTFLGGNGYDKSTFVQDIALSQSGKVFITGNSRESSFPVTADAYQKSIAGDNDAFLSMFSSNFDQIVYSTLWGGTGEEMDESLAVMEDGDVVIAGSTYSLDFPITAGAVDDTLTFEGMIMFEAFITKFHFKDNSTAVESSPKPSEFRITGLYPNPFNPSTTIEFSLPEPGEVTLSIYSTTGQRVYTSNLTFYERGQKRIRFDGKDNSGNALSSGVYFIRIDCGENYDARKMMMVK